MMWTASTILLPFAKFSLKERHTGPLDPEDFQALKESARRVFWICFFLQISKNIKINISKTVFIHICKCIPNRLVLEENQLLREAEAGARQRLERVQVGFHERAEESFKMRKIYKGNHKVEAQKRLGKAEEELASHRIENSRLSLANQRLQEEVCQIYS